MVRSSTMVRLWSMMRRVLLTAVSAVALMAASPAFAQQSVYCTNCETLTQGLAAYARQLLQLENEISIAKNAVANTIALPSTVCLWICWA